MPEAVGTCSYGEGPRRSRRRLHRIHPLVEAVAVAGRPLTQPRAYRFLEEKGIPTVDEEVVSRLFEKYCYYRTPDEATCSSSVSGQGERGEILTSASLTRTRAREMSARLFKTRTGFHVQSRPFSLHLDAFHLAQRSPSFADSDG